MTPPDQELVEIILSGALILLVIFSVLAGWQMLQRLGIYDYRPMLQLEPWWIAGGLVIVLLGVVIAPEGLLQGFTLNPQYWVETTIPLLFGVQTALAFNVTDDPTIELCLACPRPIQWLPLERLTVILASQAGVALVGIVLTLRLVDDVTVLELLLRWLPAALFFSGLGLYVSIRSRSGVFGMAMVGVFWFLMVAFERIMVPGAFAIAPFDLIQPFFWGISTYLLPEYVSDTNYLINRLLVSFIGIGLVIHSMRLLNDSEWLLTGKKQVKQ